jgi:hypothetical protein
MTIADQIYSIVNTLPQEQASKILNFAEIIRTSHLITDRPIPEQTDLTAWQGLVYALAGSWGEDFPSLEEICSDSEDVLRESL